MSVNLQTNSLPTSIKTEHRDHRSTSTAALQKVLSPFKEQLLKPPPAKPAGSTKLVPHEKAYKSCRITEKQVEDTWIYSFSKANADDPETIKLFYFSGGGFRSGAAKEHWLLCAELCAHLPGYEVNLVSCHLTR